MSKYDELSKALSTLQAQQHQYWSKLEAVYSTIANQYASYLGVSDITVKLNGEISSPIVTGSRDATKNIVINTPAPLLKRKDKSLIFDISILLCPEGSYDVVLPFLLQANIKKNGDEYHLEAPELEIKVICYEVDGRVDFTSFFDRIQLILMKKLASS
ncbi:TPA: hypothetical protein OMU10_002684 [Enterobacter hormaechei]|nr:hypothetical protein [Enterobacter hormaechei]